MTASPILSLNTQALTQNYLMLSRLAAPATAAVVVKANAYGIGLETVANTLIKTGAKTFYVATPDEGEELRRLLPVADIVVFNGFSTEEKSRFKALRLTPVINTVEQAVLCAQVGLTSRLQLETGMHRSGLPEADWPTVARHIAPALVFSHLACSDNPNVSFNKLQYQKLMKAKNFWPNAKFGLAASWGIFSDPSWRLDEVRLGAALYGAIPREELKQIIELTAPILEIRTVPAGEYVGYDATWGTGQEPRRIATLGIGYADGYPRALSNKGFVHIGNIRCPVVGRVSMDLLTVDVQDVPEQLLERQTQAIVYGEHYNINAVATDAGTIAYEILTRLGSRVLRRIL